MKSEYRVQIVYRVPSGYLTQNLVVQSTSYIGAMQGALREVDPPLTEYAEVTRITVRWSRFVEA